jgi:hypothetical protein
MYTDMYRYTIRTTLTISMNNKLLKECFRTYNFERTQESM